MPSEKTIPRILEIAKASQVIAANTIADNTFFKGGDLDKELAIKIYMERLPVERLYNLYPQSTELRPMANYLYALLGRLAIDAENQIENVGQAKPVVTGPADQVLSISGTASFTITVTSVLPYTIRWFKNGIEVAGQTGLTYSYPATVANTGDQVNALVTNAAGSASSRIATLTVNNVLQGFFAYLDADSYPDLAAGIDNLNYQLTFPITNGQPLSIDFPVEASNNRYNVTKYPVGQGVKTSWINTNLNYGQVPDSVYHSVVTIGQFYYIISRDAMSLDPAQNLIFS